MGRPRTVLDLVLIEALAQKGYTDADIARQCGFSRQTIARRKKDNEAFEAALRAGRERAHGEVSNALYRKAIKGDVAAITWYEKTRRGFRDMQDMTSNGETVKAYAGFDPAQVGKP